MKRIAVAVRLYRTRRDSYGSGRILHTTRRGAHEVRNRQQKPYAPESLLMVPVVLRMSAARRRAGNRRTSTRPATSRAIAENVFYEYYRTGHSSSISAWDASRGTYLAGSCNLFGAQVGCSTSDGGDVHFSSSSVDAYTTDGAARYAASGKAGPSG